MVAGATRLFPLVPAPELGQDAGGGGQPLRPESPPAATQGAAHPVPGACTVFPFHSLPSLRGSKRLSADNREEEEEAEESSVTRTHARGSPVRALLFSTGALPGGGHGPAVSCPWEKVPCCAGQAGGAPARVCLT